MDNPNWETQNLDANWTKSTPLAYVEPELSDWAKHWQKCFQERKCTHRRIYSPEDDCLSCRIMFDGEGKLINLNSTNTSPIPYSPATITDDMEEYTIIDMEEKETQVLNKESCTLIKEITQAYPLLDTVFPDLPYEEKSSYDEALNRRNQLNKVKKLAKDTFPANFNFTYLDARQHYFDYRGYCDHNFIYNIERPFCNKCTEPNIKLRGYHAQDYQHYADKMPTTTF